MATKLELQQINAKLAADNLYLREQLSLLQTRLQEADQRCKKLIASRNHGNPDRRAAMEAARELAIRTGTVARVDTKGGEAAQRLSFEPPKGM